MKPREETEIDQKLSIIKDILEKEGQQNCLRFNVTKPIMMIIKVLNMLQKLTQP